MPIGPNLPLTVTAEDSIRKGLCVRGACPTLTFLLRRTIHDHLRPARPAPKNRETSLDLARDGELVEP